MCGVPFYIYDSNPDNPSFHMSYAQMFMKLIFFFSGILKF